MRNNSLVGHIKKWIDRIVNLCFYLIVLILFLFVMQLFFVASFKIPTDSMEPELLAGDYILVDKVTKGARLFNVLAALRNEEVPIYRMPGTGSFERNDVLVFNFPFEKSRWDSIAFDVMRYYVKRCIALPGDTLEIRNSYYRVRGEKECLGNVVAQHHLATIADSCMPGGLMASYPWKKELGWTIKEFGPLPVPVKGQTVKMDNMTYALYRPLIEWEQKHKLRLDEQGDVFLSDSLIHEYCFRENYYFVAGDKLLNSQDSRYWGLLPESFIVGKAWKIWKSVDMNTGKIRWNRILKNI